MGEPYHGEIISRIGPCSLPDEQCGYWMVVRCEEYSAFITLAGGLDALHPLSSFTNLERSDRGEPFIFTCWEVDGQAAFATGGHPDDRDGLHRPCRLVHAVFVPVPGSPAEGDRVVNREATPIPAFGLAHNPRQVGQKNVEHVCR